MHYLTKTLLGAAALGLLVTLPVQADWDRGRDRNSPWERIERQQSRIEQGVQSGALTHREARSLYRENREIRNLARDFRRNDGRLSHEERRILDSRLDQVSERIRYLNHNDRRRYDDDRGRAGYDDRFSRY